MGLVSLTGKKLLSEIESFSFSRFSQCKMIEAGMIHSRYIHDAF